MQRNARQARSRNAGKGKNHTPDTTDKVVKEVKVDPEEEEDLDCLTCVESIEFFAVGDACDHAALCGKCAIRQRKLYNKPDCVLCQVCFFINVLEIWFGG